MSAIVIGAGGTIGVACVTALLENGDTVFAADLREPEIPGARGVSLDVTDSQQVEGVLAEIDNRQPLSAVIYAAGLNTTGPLDSVDWADYDRVMAVNLRGAFSVGAALLHLMRKNPRTSSHVFISSTAGLAGEAGGSVYCASKFGLRGFVESYAAEIAPFGGRANTVCPGNVDSPMLRSLAAKFAERQGRSTDEVMADLANSSAFGRLIEPAEVASVCRFLVSTGSSGVSGQTLVVDGAPA